MKKWLLIAALLVSQLPAQEAVQPLKLVQTIPVHVDGRMDHMHADVQGMRLFVAALGNNTVEVIDLRTGRWLRSLPGFLKPQGVWYIPGLNKLFIASGNDGTCKVFDGTTLAPLSTIKLDLGADLIGYNPKYKRLYVGYGGEDAKKDYGNVAVIDPRKEKHIGDIRTKAHPGAIMPDTSGQRVFVTIPKASELAVIDPNSNAIIKTWQAAEAQQTVTLAYDDTSRRLFVGTRKPPRIIVYDATTYSKVADFPTIELLDGMFFDHMRKRLYVSGGEGFVEVFQQQDANRYTSAARIPTGPMARTSLFVPELNRYYVAVPRKGEDPAEIRVYEPQ